MAPSTRPTPPPIGSPAKRTRSMSARPPSPVTSRWSKNAPRPPRCGRAARRRQIPTRLRGLSSELSIWCEVLPDLLEHPRIDQPGVAFGRLLLRIQHKLDGPAMRPERSGVKHVQTFVDGIALGDALF